MEGQWHNLRGFTKLNWVNMHKCLKQYLTYSNCYMPVDCYYWVSEVGHSLLSFDFVTVSKSPFVEQTAHTATYLPTISGRRHKSSWNYRCLDKRHLSWVSKLLQSLHQEKPISRASPVCAKLSPLLFFPSFPDPEGKAERTNTLVPFSPGRHLLLGDRPYLHLSILFI
jgi:hypothetical protein